MDDLQKQIDELKEEIKRLKQIRVTQMDIVPGAIKQRHLVASTTMTEGNLFYGDGKNNFVQIEPGTEGQVLTMVSGIPEWA